MQDNIHYFVLVMCMNDTHIYNTKDIYAVGLLPAQGPGTAMQEDGMMIMEDHHGPDIVNFDQNCSLEHCKHEELSSNEDLSAAVRGFVVASDRDLLLSEQKEVEKRYQCCVCGMGFAIARVCETHEILEHQIPAPWKCNKCGMQFIHGALFNLHMIRSHLVRPHMCAFNGCSAIFYSKVQLTFHKQQHQEALETVEGASESKFVYRCPFCPQEFPHQSKLMYHMRKHTGELPYKCAHCPKAYRLSSERSKHMQNAHFRIRNHLCDWCGKKFFNTEQLRRHARSHTGEKPYSCPVCSRSFSKSNTMRVHMRQHTGEKPYQCDQCGQSFTVRVSLRTHLKSKHNIIVDTSKYRRKEESDDSCMPPIGRPRKKDKVIVT